MKKNNIISNFWNLHYDKWGHWNRWDEITSNIRFNYELNFLKKYIKKNKIDWNYLELWFWNWKFFKQLNKKFSNSVWLELSDIASKKLQNDLKNKKNIEIFSENILNIDVEKYKNYFDFIFIWWVLMFLDKKELENFSLILKKILKKWWVCIARETLSIKQTIVNNNINYIDYVYSKKYLKSIFNNNFLKINNININHSFWISGLNIVKKYYKIPIVGFMILNLFLFISNIMKIFKETVTDNYFIIIKKR